MVLSTQLKMAEKMTESAVASALEGSNITYEDLADMEKAFDDAETEISKFPL
jgi:hypothetical protein